MKNYFIQSESIDNSNNTISEEIIENKNIIVNKIENEYKIHARPKKRKLSKKEIEEKKKKYEKQVKEFEEQQKIYLQVYINNLENCKRKN